MNKNDHFNLYSRWILDQMTTIEDLNTQKLMFHEIYPEIQKMYEFGIENKNKGKLMFIHNFLAKEIDRIQAA